MNLEETAKKIQSQFRLNESIKKFDDFIKDVEKEPEKYCRNAAKYLKDTFDYYGNYEISDISGDPILRWKLFDNQSIFGHERIQNQIYSQICAFTEHKINKIILLHGPNGSAKTSIISAIMTAMEDYSKLPEGAVYTFNWIFSDKEEKEVSLGFTPEEKERTDSLAFTKSEDISFKLPCSMKDSPLLLIPKEERQKFLQNLNIKQMPDFLQTGELCQKCYEIYNQLLIAYNGDWLKIVRHIQVERFYFSKRFRKGLVSIDPQKNIDANSRPINLENSYRIPTILSMASIYEPYGDLIDANRGLVEFSELLKRNPEANKYLLTTAESGCISLPGLTGYLDCVIFATENEKQLTFAKAMDNDWASFNGRLAYIRVPYLLQYSKEIPLYKKALIDLNRLSKKHIAPHTDTIIALWAVITRLRASRHAVAKTLSFLQKALLYDKLTLPDKWRDEEKKELLGNLESIVTEFEDSRDKKLQINENSYLEDASYEGRNGASYREITAVISQTLYNKEIKHLTPLNIINAIDKLSKDTSLYEFLRLPRELGHATNETITFQLNKYYLNLIAKDLRDSSNLIDEEAYLKTFEFYIKNIKSWITKEKIQNAQTQNWEEPNENLMKTIEDMFEVEEDEQSAWRSCIFEKIAAFSIENPGKAIPYKQLFGDVLDVLKIETYKKHKEQLIQLLQGILYKETEDWQLLDINTQKLVDQAIANMLNKGYSEQSLKEAVVTLLRSEDEIESL